MSSSSDDQNSPPQSDSQSPPSLSSSSSPSAPSPDSSSSPPSPPSDSSSSSPPSSSSSSSPPPPNDSSPPPPSNSGSPPPPSDKSPPPPSDNSSPTPPSNNNPSPPNSNNNNNGNNKFPPPPPPKSRNGSPPPPPPSRNSTPSPPNSRSLPSSKQTPSSSDSPSSDRSTDQKYIIAGAAGAGAVLLLIMIICVVCCCRRKRKNRDQMYFYKDNSNGKNYYNKPSHASWQASGPASDHVVKIPPPPGSANVSSEYSWAVPPPPPPPMMSSSDFSSAGFSGPHQAALPPPHPAMALGFNQSSFSYDDLAAATGGFAKVNLLGQGGFGYVHKGVLPNGKEIAVKSLKLNSGQGEREFQAEVDIISRVHHRHLVSLVGYCIAGSQRMLVYEFVPNNSLEYHLHGADRPVMDWATRHKIAMGSAKGFAYLHEDCHPRIIHRDIKAANILIDNSFEAKVADFGLAKLSSDNYTHVSTRIMGTFGYLAPEYASSGKLTDKSDVYSYGIMLLELITGRRPIDINSDEDSLVDWARPILNHVNEGGSYEELVDPRLEDNYDHLEMERMVACAAASIRHSARRRPKMSQIVRALEGDVSLEALNEGMKPGHNKISDSSGGDSEGYPDMKKLRKAAGLSSQEFSSSSEYTHSGGESQEIGSNPGNRMHKL